MPLDGFKLTWIFFGYSTTYSIIIGAFQVLGCILLLVGRTRLLGAFILVPIMFNVLLIDILYGIPIGATLNAAVYLSCLVGILCLNWKKMRDLIRVIFASQSPKLVTRDNAAEYFGYTLIGCLILVLIRAGIGLLF